MFKKIFLFLIIIFILSGGFYYYKKHEKSPDTRKNLVFWSIQLKPVYEKQLLNIIENFEKKHPDYKIIWVDIPIQEAQKRTLASVLSDNPPDLINLNPDFSVILAQKNALMFFDEKDTLQFHSGLLNKLKYDGKIYALPYYATSPVTLYNKELFSNCTAKDFPKTYDELFSISSDLKKCSKTSVFAASLNENDTLAKILNKYGISSFETEIDKQNAFKIYSMFNNMFKKDYLPKDTLTINHREVVEKYMSQGAMSVVIGSNFINMVKQNAPDVYSKSALVPQLSASNTSYDVSLMNLIIPKKAKNKALALEFALLLTNKENQLELSKITNVLPSNKEALLDDYFKSCSADLVEQSRCVSVKQLDNLTLASFGDKNKKEINEILNKTLEEILLNKNSDEDLIKNKIEAMVRKIMFFQK